MGGKSRRSLKVRVGWECFIRREGARKARLSSGVYKLEESEEKVTVLVGVESQKKAGRVAPEVRAAKSSEFRKGEQRTP